MRIPSFTRLLVPLGVVAALAFTAGACSSDDSDDSSPTTTVAETTMPSETTATDAGGSTIVDVASSNPDFSTLVAAVGAADLVETLSGDGPFTVFAPTNEAFEALPAGTVDELLLPENKDKLTAILTYHVVAGNVMAADLTDGQTVTTVQGEDLTVGVADGSVTLTDAGGNSVTVVTADVAADNGVIHAIDGVLLPAAAA